MMAQLSFEPGLGADRMFGTGNSPVRAVPARAEVFKKERRVKEDFICSNLFSASDNMAQHWIDGFAGQNIRKRLISAAFGLANGAAVLQCYSMNSHEIL